MLPLNTFPYIRDNIGVFMVTRTQLIIASMDAVSGKALAAKHPGIVFRNLNVNAEPDKLNSLVKAHNVVVRCGFACLDFSLLLALASLLATNWAL
jgi:hypothetical protein